MGYRVFQVLRLCYDYRSLLPLWQLLPPMPAMAMAVDTEDMAVDTEATAVATVATGATGTARGLLMLRLSPDTDTMAAMAVDMVVMAATVATTARGLLMPSLRLRPRLSPDM